MNLWIDTAFTAADGLFWRLLWVSLQGAGVTVLVWALCRFVPALSAANRCWLWWIVCAQLLLGLLSPEPWRRELPAELPAQIPHISKLATPTARWHAPWQAWLDEPAQAAPPQRNMHRTEQEPGLDGAADVGARFSAAPSRWAAIEEVRWTSWLGFLWLAAVLFALGRLAVEYRRLARTLATSTPASQALDTCLREEATALAVGRLPRLLISEAIASPMLCGALRPSIVLPAQALSTLDALELRLALRHELLHLRRGDLFWGWIPALAQRLFCFNPLAVLAAREYDLAREAAVDAALLRDARDSTPSYGRLLIALGVTASPAPALATASPTFKTLHRRLTMLSQPHTPSPSNSLIAGAALLLAVGCSAPLATAEAPKEDDGTTLINISSDDKNHGAYVYSDGEHLLSYGTQIHLRQGEDGSIAFGQGQHNTLSIGAAKAGGKARLWYADDGRMYLLEDAATLGQVEELLKPMQDLARQQGELGEQQGALGEQQGALGAQQGELGAQQGELGAKVAQLATRRVAAQGLSEADENELDRQMDALDDQMEALAVQQEALGQQQEALGEQQEALGERQEALGQQQQEVGEQAQSQIETLMKQAIADGRAKRVETASLR